MRDHLKFTHLMSTQSCFSKSSRRQWLGTVGCGVMLGAGIRYGWGVDAGNQAELRVMSFNIRYGTANDGDNRWQHRKELVVQTVKAFNPDLLGLQEVLTGQADYLKTSLPDYSFHGVGRNDGQQNGEFAPIMYRRERFEVVDAGYFWLSETPEVPGSLSWDAAITRILSWTLLRDRNAGNRELVFANTHFDHRGEQARLESARLIRQRGSTMLNGRSVVLAGDFNATEDDAPYHAFLGGNEDNAARLIDSYRAVHPKRKPDEATYHRWEGGTTGSRIDWVLHSPDLEPLSAGIDRTSQAGQFPSDHYPVQTVLRYR